MSSDAMSLDAPEADVLTFITPEGRYTLPRAAVPFSPVLEQVVNFNSELTEFNLTELLTIGPASESVVEGGKSVKSPAHTLYQIPERYYALIFRFFNQLFLDRGVMPNMLGTERLKDLASDEEKKELGEELAASLQAGRVNPFPEYVSMFDPTSPHVLPQDYWSMVKDFTIEDVGAFDLVALNFGNYALSKLNELAGAFWIKNNEEQLPAKKHLIAHIIERDAAMKVKERERNEAAKAKERERNEAAKAKEAAK
jgi:hypothetical protein